MAQLTVHDDDRRSTLRELVASRRNELRALDDDALMAFLGSAGRRPVVQLRAVDVPVCTRFQSEGAPHTALTVEEEAGAV